MEKLRETQKNSEALQEEHLEQLTEHYALKKKTTQEIELRKLQHIEQVKKVASKHKWYLKSNHGMLRRLLIPDYEEGVIIPVIGSICILIFLLCSLQNFKDIKQTQGIFIISLMWGLHTDFELLIKFNGWKTITEEEKKYQILLRRNTTHLVQSNNTPYADGCLARAIGLDGETEIVEDILQGKLNMDDYLQDDQITIHPLLPKATEAFTKALQIPKSTKTNLPLPELPSTITQEEYQAIFNHTKETTASVPPLHYGHFKAACKSDDLLQVNLTFMNIHNSTKSNNVTQ